MVTTGRLALKRPVALSSVTGRLGQLMLLLVILAKTSLIQDPFLPCHCSMAKLNTVRVLLSIATNCDRLLLQFDVKNTFLHGDLKEEIYMDFPPSIPVTSKKGIVCKLLKSLYRLK
ncbi:unnamed protein product [Prunus brigantina]